MYNVHRILKTIICYIKKQLINSTMFELQNKLNLTPL